MCFKSFLLLVKRKVKDNNTEKTKDIEACIYIIYYLHNLEFEFGLQSGRNFFPYVRLLRNWEEFCFPGSKI